MPAPTIPAAPASRPPALGMTLRSVACETTRVMSGTRLSLLPTLRLDLARLVSKDESPSGWRRAIDFALAA